MLPGILASCEKPPERVHRRCGNLRNSFEDRWFNSFCFLCSPHKPMQRGSGIPPSYESSPTHSCSPLSTGGLPSCTSGAIWQRCCNGCSALIQTGWCMLARYTPLPSSRTLYSTGLAGGSRSATPELPENKSASSAPVALLPLFLPVGLSMQSLVRATSSSSVAASLVGR